MLSIVLRSAARTFAGSAESNSWRRRPSSAITRPTSASGEVSLPWPARSTSAAATRRRSARQLAKAFAASARSSASSNSRRSAPSAIFLSKARNRVFSALEIAGRLPAGLQLPQTARGPPADRSSSPSRTPPTRPCGPGDIRRDRPASACRSTGSSRPRGSRRSTFGPGFRCTRRRAARSAGARRAKSGTGVLGRGSR